MKKVIKTEEANLTEEEKSKRIVRALKAIYLATLIGFTSYATIDSINRINKEKEYVIIEDNLLAEIVINDDITLEIVKPDTITTNGITTKVAPEGYTIDNGLCYKLTTEGEIPTGYSLGEDNRTLIRTDENQITEEGYIVVGNKAIDVISPKNSTKNGFKYFSLPKGYFLVGDVGVGIFDYEKELSLSLSLQNNK